MAIPQAALEVNSQLYSSSYISLLIFLAAIWKYFADQRRSAKVPSIGYGTLPFLKQWRGAVGFMRYPVKYMTEGYARYKGSYFKISTLQAEYVIVTDKDKIAEYLAAPDHVLNFQDAANDALQIPWTLGYGVAYRTYHVPAVRITLTQHISANIPGMLEQIEEGMDAFIGEPKDWTEVPIYDVTARIIAKVSNRALSGTMLCRNDRHLDNAIAYARDVFLSSEMIRPFPNWMKPLLIKLTPINQRRRLAIKLLGPIVEERLKTDYAAQGEKRPDDMIQWLVDSAPLIERTVPQIVERIMALNVASIHTTTMTLTSALYQLGAEWEKYTPALRDEVRQHCESGKITKQALAKLVKLDSFLRESGRFNNTGLVSLNRNARKEFCFKDGTTIPAGARIGAPSLALHNEPEFYHDPHQFDGFRFSRMKDESGKPTKHQMISTDIEYLPFGHGKHACPGRFFAVNEMKLIFSHLLLRYDLKLIPGTAPTRKFIGQMAIPETKLKVLMKSVHPRHQSSA